MSNFSVDLTNCDREPIHIPGQIQSHGFLIVVDEKNTICFLSENSFSYVSGLPADLCGTHIQDFEHLICTISQPHIISQVIEAGRLKKSFERINPVPLEIAGVQYYMIVAFSGDHVMLEFEPALSTFDVNVQSVIGYSIADILSHKDLNKLMNTTVEQVKNIIEYDRVMIYKFAADGHGEVVSEAVNDDLPPWLGLHYPASDIPQQARALYKKNLTRLIADVHSEPSKIQTYINSPLDLTSSQLRAVSPIHIQYLKNMAVASSFSISIICNDELWGLVACHNYTSRFIDFRSREYAKLIGQILASALQYREELAAQQLVDRSKTDIIRLAKALLEKGNLRDALKRETVAMLDLVNAAGAAIIYQQKTELIGITPQVTELAHIVQWLNVHNTEVVYQTDCISALIPEATEYRNLGSGMLAIELMPGSKDYIIWFKPEVLQNINWAGRPEKTTSHDETGILHISPRHSFEVWSEQVSGHSTAWSLQDIQSAQLLNAEISYAINLKEGAVRALNESLKQAYEELETFSYTISHDLKSPIASIKGYAQLLLRDQQIIERGQKMAQRIADRADQMNLMIGAVLDYSRIGKSHVNFTTVPIRPVIEEIILELKHQYPDLKLVFNFGETPDIHGDPTMLMQVFSNLIGNAVKYSQYTEQALVQISGELKDNTICYTIKDNGLGIAPKDLPRIFELFNRMENVRDIEGSGVGLSIVKRIVEKHRGKIRAESELGKSSTFFVTFNI